MTLSTFCLIIFILRVHICTRDDTKFKIIMIIAATDSTHVVARLTQPYRENLAGNIIKLSFTI